MLQGAHQGAKPRIHFEPSRRARAVSVNLRHTGGPVPARAGAQQRPPHRFADSRHSRLTAESQLGKSGPSCSRRPRLCEDSERCRRGAVVRGIKELAPRSNTLPRRFCVNYGRGYRLVQCRRGYSVQQDVQSRPVDQIRCAVLGLLHPRIIAEMKPRFAFSGTNRYGAQHGNAR